MKNTFTLIKEGKTKKISQLKHDLFACDEKAYTLELDTLKRKEYQILEDVELLYFKNFNFNDTICFSCQNKDTILMLENCNFSKTTNFHSGNVVISTPKFNQAFSTIDFFGNKEVELHLEDDDKTLESNPPLYNLNGAIDSLFITGNMKDSLLSIRCKLEHMQIKNLSVSSERALRSLEWFCAQNMKIEDSNISSWDLKPYCKNLEIKNSRIEGCLLNLERSKVKLDNATLKFSKIMLPDGIILDDAYDTTELYFSSYDSERYEECQATWQQRLEHNIEKRDFYMGKVKECHSILDGIEEEKARVTENVEKSLKKQKVKTMIASPSMKK